jgi:hypothetical protein
VKRPPMRVRTLAGALTAGWILLPAAPPAEAQELGTDCELREYTTIRSAVPVEGRRVTWLSDPFLVCPDGTRIRSDSAVVYEANRRAELIGRVRFETDERLLESRLADYYETEGRLYARGSVVFTDRQRGTVVRGDTLVHLAAMGARIEDEVTVTGARPSAVIPPTAEDRPDAPSPYRVVGNRLRFEGEQYFWADGDVEVDRDDLRAFADSLVFDQREGQLFLIRNARVVDEAEMEGGRINLDLPGDVLQGIVIRDRGRLRTDDLDLVGEEIRITLRNEKIQHLVAVHREPPDPDADPPPRPRAVTAEFMLEADSLDVLSPDEVLEIVHAVGRARGESRDRGPAPLPVEVDEEGLVVDDPAEMVEDAVDEAVEAEVPSVMVDRDWIEGNEIVAYFEPAPPPVSPLEDVEDPAVAAVEEDRAQYRLTHLVARGDARTLYRSPPSEDRPEEPEPDEPEEDRPPPVEEQLWSISYIVAGEIAIFLTDGQVERMEAQDKVVGLQLEPERTGQARRDGGPEAQGGVSGRPGREE